MVNSNKDLNQTDRSGISAKWFDRDTRWTLLFVGNRGKPITLKRFKGMVLITVVIIIVSISSGVGLFLWNRNILHEKNQLESQLKNIEAQTQQLRHERDILMTRLVLSGAHTVNKQETSPEKPIDEQQLERDELVTAPVAPPVPIAVTQTKTEIRDQVSNQPENAPTDSGLGVAIENFKVSARSGSNSLRVQFKLKNTSLYSQYVSGHAVVVLKGEAIEQGEWLSMPKIALVDGKPTGRQQGNGFGISNYRIMKFRASKPPSFETYQTASVYIFTKTGELLLEQDFALKLDR
jgi:hypothetical protein